MLKAHRIAVWVAPLSAVSEALWPRVAALLDANEQASASRFLFARHRRQYTASHALKRLMLTALGGAPSWAWTFEIAPGGKPRVARDGGPHFNLSHCEGLVACAVSPDVELGIDVEPVTRDAPLELLQRNFAPEEESWLSSLPESERRLGFFRLWTLKEAFIKATGRGLAQPLQDFAFAFDPLRVSFKDSALGRAADWNFEQHLIGGEHVLAIAWCGHNQDASVEIREVSFETLLTEHPATANDGCDPCPNSII